MFYPLQIPSILDQTFRKLLDYQEFVNDKLKDHIMCIWSMRSKDHLSQTVNNVILPDACVDLLINFTTQEILFVATSRATKNLPLSGKVDFMGVRFRPGVFYNIFGVDCASVMDKIIPYQQIEKQCDLSQILQIKSYKDRLRFLIDYLNNKIRPNQIDQFVNLTNQTKLKNDIKYTSGVADKLNCGIRQANRIFKQRCGISIKAFLNVVRLHESLRALIYSQGNNLARIANQSGFYDQSHFIREIKRYTGISPLELVNNYRKMS